MQNWKKDIDEKVKAHVNNLSKVFDGLEYYRGKRSFNIADDRAFKPIEKTSKVDDWRATLTAMQMALKNTRKDSHENLLATKEVINLLIPAFMDLKSAYEIQGQVVLALCDICGISFEEAIEKHVYSYQNKEPEHVEQHTQNQTVREVDSSTEELSREAAAQEAADAFFG